MAKPGVDGHWRGLVTVSRGLRDAGFEVIFAGFQTLEQTVESAIQEDCDVIGLSIHSGAHEAFARRFIKILEEKNARQNFLLLMGGAIPTADFDKLKEIGIDMVFGPGTMMPDIIKFIKENVKVKKVEV